MLGVVYERDTGHEHDSRSRLRVLMTERRRHRIVLVGASGHASVVADAIERAERHWIVGVIDHHQTPGSEACGYPVLGDERVLAGLVAKQHIDGVIVCIGDNATRWRVSRKVAAAAPTLAFVSIVHPFTSVASSAKIGPGAFIGPGAVIAPRAVVGAHAVVNTGATLDHDSVLGEGASLAPGVAVGGNVTIGDVSAVSIGASVSHGITIGAHSVIGAGAIVLSDLPDHCIAYGVPARVVRSRGEGERYL